MITNDDLSLEELEFLTTNSTPIRNNLRQTQLQMTRGKIYFQARVTQSFGGRFNVNVILLSGMRVRSSSICSKLLE